MGHFRAGRFAHAGRDWLVVRSGWSGQDGFEVFVEGGADAPDLWDAALEAGADLQVQAGCPNEIERLEVGLLSHGIDTAPEDSVLEAGLGRFVSDSQLGACIGGAALARERQDGSARMLKPVEIFGDLPQISEPWPIWSGDTPVGELRAAAHSPDLGKGIGVAMIARRFWDTRTYFTVEGPAGPLGLTVKPTFWR